MARQLGMTHVAIVALELDLVAALCDGEALAGLARCRLWFTPRGSREMVLA